MSRRTSERGWMAAAARSAAGLWFVVFVAALLIGFQTFGIAQRIAAVVLAGAIATAAIALNARRHRQELARVEQAAREIPDLSLADRVADIGERSALEKLLDDAESSGEFTGLVGELARIARRLEREIKELAKKSRNIESLIDAIDEPLIATDNHERIILCNPSAELILNPADAQNQDGSAATLAASGTLMGRAIREVLTHSQVLGMYEAARKGSSQRGRAILTTPLGRRVFQVSAIPSAAAWGEGIFGTVMILRDVTELDQAVQVKAEFVANASHELRTPVSAIRGAAETLHDAVEDDPAMARRLASMIQDHALRLEELLRDLLDLSRLESTDVEVTSQSVSLREIEDALTMLFEPICTERGLRLEFEFEPELAHIKTDRKLLMLILRNLVENATKFAFEKTTVRVVASVEEMRNSAQGSAGVRGIVKFEVIDQGPGIPLNLQERVFERFFQVDPARTGASSQSRRGTGLGLAIVKHAAKRLGGHVGLESVWGQGTRVWVEMPVEFVVVEDIDQDRG